MSDMLLYYMWLTAALAPGNPRKWDILGGSDSPRALYESGKGEGLRLTLREKQALGGCSLKTAEDILDYCERRGIRVYCPEDNGFPKRLEDIDDPPMILFTLGALEDIDFTASAAVVGARRAHRYAIGCTELLSGGLASRGVVIVSGCAVGVDTAAHTSAIEAGGKTVAVLGCGLEYDYPKGAMPLKRRIKQSGAVISEFLPQAAPAKMNFPMRNRIVAGLSDCIICTQASSKSGALNTVSQGVSLGREIFVTPPDILSPDYDGVIDLLRDGIEQVYSHEDVIRAMKW